jgi:hypothetical protein
MFKSEFAPEAIHAAAWRADKFGSAPAYLNRVMADAVAELQAIKAVADSADCTAYEKQFCGPRSVEAFRAFNTARHLLEVFETIPADEKELVNA